MCIAYFPSHGETCEGCMVGGRKHRKANRTKRNTFLAIFICAWFDINYWKSMLTLHVCFFFFFWLFSENELLLFLLLVSISHAQFLLSFLITVTCYSSLSILLLTNNFVLANFNHIWQGGMWSYEGLQDIGSVMYGLRSNLFCLPVT